MNDPEVTMPPLADAERRLLNADCCSLSLIAARCRCPRFADGRQQVASSFHLTPPRPDVPMLPMN
jgi:hypothetical protein